MSFWRLKADRIFQKLDAIASLQHDSKSMKSILLLPLKKPVSATLDIPGSKSYTNRALFLAALTEKKVLIKNPLISEDTKAMIECLRMLGVRVQQKEKMIEVNPKEILNQGSPDLIGVQNDKRSQQSYSLSAKLSGTTIRFILALACIVPGVKMVFGDEGLNKRPIGDLVDALVQLGAQIEYLDKKGFPPVKVLSSHLRPGTIKISGSVSSQFISSILMIVPLIGEVNIEVIGDQVSKPYIDMTIDIVGQFGVIVQNNNYTSYRISAGQKYNADEYTVEGDFSGASYFFAIAALTRSTITLKNLNPNSLQADLKFTKILEQMGNKIVPGNNEITILGKGIKPLNIDMEDCPDQVMTLAVLAAFANGTTIITGVQSLKIKETDRITALKQEFEKMGIRVAASSSKITIYGGNPKPARIKTYGDHRMAMAFAVAGSKLEGIEIEHPDVVNKTFPDFWKKLGEIGIKTVSHPGTLAIGSEKKDSISRQGGFQNDGYGTGKRNIVLIGMRGSGKTTIAKLLSKRLRKKYVELDKMISEKVGMPIAKIVEKYGWEYFRNKETEIVNEASKFSDRIISTGGGVVTRSENVEVLKKNGMLLFLDTSINTLVKRMGKDSKRPFLTSKKTRREEIEQVLSERKKIYENAADIIIKTDNLSSEEVTNKIIEMLKQVQHDIK